MQIVSAVVDEVAHLSLFQRTAQWIMPQENPAYTDEQKASYRADARQLQEMHAHLAEMFGMFAQRGRRQELAADQDDRRDVCREPRSERA